MRQVSDRDQKHLKKELYGDRGSINVSACDGDDLSHVSQHELELKKWNNNIEYYLSMNESIGSKKIILLLIVNQCPLPSSM